METAIVREDTTTTEGAIGQLVYLAGALGLIGVMYATSAILPDPLPVGAVALRSFCMGVAQVYMVVFTTRVWGPPPSPIRIKTRRGALLMLLGLHVFWIAVIALSLARADDPLGALAASVPMFGAWSFQLLTAAFGGRVLLGPGSRLLAVLRFIYTRRRCELLFEPIVADEALEWIDVSDRLSRAVGARARCALALKEGVIGIRCNGRLLWCALLRPLIDFIDTVRRLR